MLTSLKWTRRGKLFDPRDHKLAGGGGEFAQSPQALVFDDFVRIYFSTRELEPATGKYLSHIAYADFDKSLSALLRVSQRPVIALGGAGLISVASNVIPLQMAEMVQQHAH